MTWIERNVDGYRAISEILNGLRTFLAERLLERHGDEWFRTALPDGLLDRLIAAKEDEKAVDWYENEYQQVMSYAVFSDLVAIVEHDPDLFPTLGELAPNRALLHARLVELEVVRGKISRARPISEPELVFLGTFLSRFRRLLNELDENGAPAEKPVPPSDPVPAVAGGGDTTEADSPAPVSSPETAPEPEQRSEPEQPSPAKETPPQRKASSPSVQSGTAPSMRPSRPATTPPAEPKDVPQPESSLDTALETGDNRSVLRALYREVTSLAEGVWSGRLVAGTQVWDQVSASSWYEINFSRLGLKPLSDFYEIIAAVRRMLADGVSKVQIQDHLKEHNFAKILLSLRDMFQKSEA